MEPTLDGGLTLVSGKVKSLARPYSLAAATTPVAGVRLARAVALSQDSRRSRLLRSRSNVSDPYRRATSEQALPMWRLRSRLVIQLLPARCASYRGDMAAFMVTVRRVRGRRASVLTSATRSARGHRATMGLASAF